MNGLPGSKLGAASVIFSFARASGERPSADASCRATVVESRQMPYAGLRTERPVSWRDRPDTRTPSSRSARAAIAAVSTAEQ